MPTEPGQRAAMGRAFEGAFQAGLCVVVGVVLGYYADRWLGTDPVFLFVLTVLGGVAAVRTLLHIGVPASESAESPGGAPPATASLESSSDRDPDQREPPENRK